MIKWRLYILHKSDQYMYMYKYKISSVNEAVITLSVHLIFKDTFNIFVSEKFTKMLTTRNTLIDMFYTIIFNVHCISIVTSWYLETLFIPPEWPVFCCPWSVDTWWCVPATWVGRLTGEGGSPALKEGQSAECMYVAAYQYRSVFQYKYAYQNHNISMKINTKISLCITDQYQYLCQY